MKRYQSSTEVLLEHEKDSARGWVNSQAVYIGEGRIFIWSTCFSAASELTEQDLEDLLMELRKSKVERARIEGPQSLDELDEMAREAAEVESSEEFDELGFVFWPYI
jgi:hypothetical protein